MIEELAKVVAIHPESNCVDVVVLRTGAPLSAVRVLSEMATGQTGVADLHLPDAANGYDSENTGKRDIVAAISYYREIPFVVGFLFPEVAECLFARPDFRVDRHASDVYHTIDAAGNIELAHPSGAFVRIAESPAHEDLTGKDYDSIWKIARNTGRAVHIHVEQAGGKASIDIAPSGAITIVTASTITATSAGETTLNAPHVTVNTPEMFVSGNIKANGTILDMAASGGRSMDSMREQYNDHTHNDPQGGSVDPTDKKM